MTPRLRPIGRKCPALTLIGTENEWMALRAKECFNTTCHQAGFSAARVLEQAPGRFEAEGQC